MDRQSLTEQSRENLHEAFIVPPHPSKPSSHSSNLAVKKGQQNAARACCDLTMDCAPASHHFAQCRMALCIGW